MKKSSIIWIVVIVLVVLIGGYVWWMSASSSQTTPPVSATNATSTTNTPDQSGQNPSGGTTTPPTNASSVTGSVTLSLNTSDGDTFERHLVASNGMTVYEYNKDTANVSNCTGSCATNWPPYTVTAKQAASLGGGISVDGKIGTITRADGTLQVTYANIPLYFYIGDGIGGFTVVTS
jgi:predicted lipoprotein with Yx(FWY)xxD motif